MQFNRGKRKIELEKRFCIVCGNEIIRNTVANSKRISTKQYKKSKFCSIKCKGIFQSTLIVGKENPNYKGGKSICADCGKTLAARYAYRKKDKNYCRICWSKHYRQENAYKWKGGLTDINLLERNRKEAIEWRKSVFERDDYTCQKCNKKGSYLHAHHIKQFSKYPELRFNIDNGITLCKDCHIKIHKK